MIRILTYSIVRELLTNGHREETVVATAHNDDEEQPCRDGRSWAHTRELLARSFHSIRTRTQEDRVRRNAVALVDVARVASLSDRADNAVRVELALGASLTSACVCLAKGTDRFGALAGIEEQGLITDAVLDRGAEISAPTAVRIAQALLTIVKVQDTLAESMRDQKPQKTNKDSDRAAHDGSTGLLGGVSPSSRGCVRHRNCLAQKLLYAVSFLYLLAEKQTALC